MGEPIYIVKGEETLTLHGRHEAAKYIGTGWRLAEDSADVSLPPVVINATDGAKELAEEYGLDLADVTGTGADGRIILKDVRAHLDSHTSAD